MSFQLFQAIDFSLQRKYPIPLRLGQSILSNLSSQATRLYATAPKQHCIKHTATTSPASIRLCCYVCFVYFSRCLHLTLLRNTFLHAGIQKCDILYLS